MSNDLSILRDVCNNFNLSKFYLLSEPTQKLITKIARYIIDNNIQTSRSLFVEKIVMNNDIYNYTQAIINKDSDLQITEEAAIFLNDFISRVLLNLASKQNLTVDSIQSALKKILKSDVSLRRYLISNGEKSLKWYKTTKKLPIFPLYMIEHVLHDFSLKNDVVIYLAGLAHYIITEIIYSYLVKDLDILTKDELINIIKSDGELDELYKNTIIIKRPMFEKDDGN